MHIIASHKERAMTQTAMTIRMDNDLKVQFDALCDEFGMSDNTAFDEIRAMVERGDIPSMALEDINEEIRLAREGEQCFRQ